MNSQYEVIVIGAGAAGENVADITARNGLNTAIIERDLVGGECTYWACIPSKMLLRPGEAIDAANRTPGVDGAHLDLDAALERRDEMAANWDDTGQVEWLESAGVDLIRGQGRIAGERTVEVEHEDGSVTTYKAGTAVVIATGTGTLIPPIEGLADIRSWNSRDVTTASEVPERLIVLGGGAVGVEMAQAWKALGAEQVTIVEMSERLMSDEEEFVSEALMEEFERIGVDVMLESEMTAVRRDADDAPVHATVTTPEGERALVGDEILVAVGRRPRTDDVGLDSIGLEPGEFISVDDRLRATEADGWLYAVGDVNGRALFTHAGKYQARIAGLSIAGNPDTRAWGDEKALPRVIFTSPQIAAVGSSANDAIDAGHDVHTVEYDTGSTAGASTLGKGYGGKARLVIDAADRTLLGATFVGPRVGEMLHAATIAIVGGVTLDQLWHAIPSFPTISEIWLRFLEKYRDDHDHTFV